jgi:cytidylate kinase
MKTKPRSIQQIVEEQVKKWRITGIEKRHKKAAAPVITISREPGSGGRRLAEILAEKYKLDLFHKRVIQEMAESAHVSERMLETLDEKGLSILEDWISSMVNDRHLWPDQYLQHLMKVVGTIGKHGHAVIVGRGANFIIPPGAALRLRIVSPLSTRIQNVSRDFDVSKDEARRRIIRTESNRRAFIRKYFNADITDPIHYDLVVNTEFLSIESVVEAVGSILE